MTEKLTTVNSRKEFIDLFRKIFIPAYMKLGPADGFNMGYAINNWETFWVCNDDESLTVIELKK